MNEPTDNRAKEWRHRYLCRFHLSHRWRTRAVDDESGRYQVCLDCGKYRMSPSPAVWVEVSARPFTLDGYSPVS